MTQPTASLASPATPSSAAAFAARWADAALLLVAVVWGTSYGVAKGALAFYPVLGFLAVRFGLTLALLLPAWWRASPAQRRGALRAGLPLGLLLLGIFLCETWGLAHTQASHAAFLISLCVVFTPLAEWALLRQRPAPAMLGFAAVSLLGATLLSGGVPGLGDGGGAWGWGDALVLAAAVLRAITVCATTRLTRGGGDTAAPVMALTAVQAAVVGAGALGLALALPGGLPPLPREPQFWWASLYLVLGCTVFAFGVQNWALRHSSPTRVGLLMGSEPVFGALFAVAWLRESLSPMGWAGGVLIVAAALLTVRRRTASR